MGLGDEVLFAQCRRSCIAVGAGVAAVLLGWIVTVTPASAAPSQPSVPALTPAQCSSLPSSVDSLKNRVIPCTATVGPQLLTKTPANASSATSKGTAVTGRVITGRVAPGTAPPTPLDFLSSGSSTVGSSSAQVTAQASNPFTICVSEGIAGSATFPSGLYGITDFLYGSCNTLNFGGTASAALIDQYFGFTIANEECDFPVFNPHCGAADGPFGAYGYGYPFEFNTGAVFFLPDIYTFLPIAACPVAIPDPPWTVAICGSPGFYHAGASQFYNLIEIEIV